MLSLLWYVTRRQFVALLLLILGTVLSALGHVTLAIAGSRLLQGMVQQQSSAFFVPTACWLLLATLTKTAAMALSVHAETTLSARVGGELRDRVAQRLLHQGTLRGDATDAAHIREAIRTIERTVMGGLIGVFRSVLQLLPLGTLMVYSAPSLTFVALGGLIPFAIALSWVRQILRRREHQTLQTVASLDAHVDVLIQHADLWRTYGSGDHVRAVLAQYNRNVRQCVARIATIRTTFSGANETLGAAAVVGVVGWGLVHPMTFSNATLMPFFLSLFWSYRPLRDFGDSLTTYQSCETALQALRPWLAQAAPTPLPKPPPSTAFAFSSPQSLMLERFGALRHNLRWNVTLPPGALVVLVGPNGSGKTTLIRSLLGLERTTGSLRYGSLMLPANAVGPKARPFAWVPQNPPVLAGTLRENLELGVVSSAEIWGELQRLDENLAWHLDERLGVTGRDLSGGERARIAILRAMATGLPVLLLDEPMASLDASAEANMLKLFQRLRGHRTLLVVTHQATLLDAADLVIDARTGCVNAQRAIRSSAV